MAGHEKGGGWGVEDFRRNETVVGNREGRGVVKGEVKARPRRGTVLCLNRICIFLPRMLKSAQEKEFR